MDEESSQNDFNASTYQDLTHLSDVDEDNVLQVLKSRYEKELIYTFIGNILVAVNPYRSLDIYGINEVKKYENRVLGSLPPHLFAIGSSAFSKLIKDNESQLFIVSGESGSGKTESIKLILQYLAAVNKSPTNIVTEQILESSPLLEQFGNAKTLKNFNSSRFGKYLEIYFKNDLIIGANIKHYLLEKPRIVSQLADERVFHVFYEILAGFTEIEKEKYGLQSADKYFYLNQGSLDEIEGKNDAQDFSFLLSSFQVLGFTNEQQDTIFRILASVLHLGNIYFHRKFLKTGQEGVEIGTDVEIRWACHLLQLNIENVLQTLTCRTTETREGDRLYTPYNIDQALDARDAIAKTLYDGLFTWLLIKLNEKTNGKLSEEQHQNIKTIAMLDFFGFENLNENSFEQLCINYGNEKLQQHFIQFVFKLEQQEYVKEKIDCELIEFQDNVQVINLLVKKPIGIFPLLDDECNFPKASDQSFLDKCHYNHALNELYARPRMSSFDFGIKHFSGVVWYSADGFLDKNRDTLKNDVIELLISSKMSMVSKMFVQYKKSMELPRANSTLSKHSSSSFKNTPSKSDLSRFTQMKPRTPTISARFQESLNQLYQKILKINNIFYVCCLKPNEEMQPLQFDEQLVQMQLSNLNLVSIVKARKAGFPVKKTFAEFAARYRCLHKQPIRRSLAPKEICELLLDFFGVHEAQFRFGVCKVFLKEPLEAGLEGMREEVIAKAVTTIQSHVRGHMQRCAIRKSRSSAIRIQSAYRCYRERKRYLATRQAIVRIQCTWKMVKQRREFKRMQIVLEQRRKEEAARRQSEKAERDARNESLNCIASGLIESLDVPEQLEKALNNADAVNLNRSERNIHKLSAEQQTNLKLTKNQLKPLPFDVDQYAFSKFTNIYFNSHAWAMKKEPIKTSFLFKSSNFEVKQSLTLFKLVLKFMNDHTLTEVREKLFLDFIINSALKHSYLRDELLCQLVNQTWKNENSINVNRGWLLMVNCLSAFCPSASLFKYLLKYLSDNATIDCRGLLQQKLLNGDAQVARKYPPTYLEWTANGRKANMALNISYSNNERKFCEVNSWSTGETVSNDLLTSKGITDSFGWSIDVEQENQLSELNGEEYLFDLMNEIENPLIANYEDDFYIFTQYENGDDDLVDVTGRNCGHLNGVLTNGLAAGHSSNNHLDRLDNLSLSMPDESDKNNIQRHRSLGSINEQIVLSKNSKLNKRYLREEESKELESLRFSETSKLNKRYTANASASNLLSGSAGQQSRKDELIKTAGVSGGVARKLNKQQSMQQHSMSNLIDIKNNSLSKRSQSLQELGLATRSALNDRYFDKNASQSNSLTRKELKQQQDNLSSNSSIHSSSSYQAPKSVKPKVLSYGNLSDLAKSNEKAAANQLIKSTSSYWYKEKFKSNPQQSNYLNVKHKVPSSAMSDISETASLAPSLASHVRGIKAPTHASELDEYLDQLFNPVLDGNLDEMSDARSLAASIKGGNGKDDLDGTYLSQSLSLRLDATSDLSNCSTLLIEPDQVEKMSFEEFKRFSLLNESEDNLCQLIKGGAGKPAPRAPKESKVVVSPFSAEAELKAQQKGAPTINTSEAGNTQSNPSSSQLNAFQNVAGMTVPMVDTSQIIQQQLVHQQMIQRAFLASAVQQNLQIQQQLLKQNQALQQLLSTNSSTSPESGSLVNSNLDSSSTDASISQSLLLQTAAGQTDPSSGSLLPDDRKGDGDELNSANRKDELKRPNEKIKILSNVSKSGVPPAPPMPTSHSPSAIAYGSRAKTVRIGKVRWPPSRLEGDGCEATPNNSNSSKSNQSNQPTHSNPPNQFSYNCNQTLKLADPTESAKVPAASGPLEEPVGDESKSRQQSGRKAGHKKEERLVITELRTDAPKSRVQQSHLNSSLNNGLLIGNALNANLISGGGGGHMNRSVSTNGINHNHHQEAKLIANSNVGKLRISSEMKAKLELLTINQSVRSTVKSSSYGKSDLMVKSMENLQDIRENSNRVNKLSKERKSLLEKQLLGQFGCSKGNSVDDLSSPNQLTTNGKSKLTNCDHENEFKLIKSAHQQNFARESRERMDELGPHKLNKLNQNSSASLGCLNFCYDCQKNEESNCKFYCRERLEYDQMSTSMCNITDLNGQFNAMHLGKKLVNETLFGENLDSGQYMLGGEVNGSKQPANGHPLSAHCSGPFAHHRIGGNQLHQLSNPSTEESIKLNTKLYPLNKLYLTYQKVPWELRLRKELFSPTERIESPMVLNFIFLQIIRDAYSPKCLRMREDERQAIIKHLETIGIGKANYLHASHKLTVQKSVVQMARKMPLYFSRFYSIINCKNHADTNQLAVSHSGLRLVRREPDELRIIETICFEDIVEITSSKETHIQILGKNNTWIHLISDKAQQIKSLIEYFIVESLKDDAKFVRAIADFQNPAEPTLLKFKKGDIIAISKNKNLKIAKGWYYGIHKATGESGLLSSKYVLPLDNPSKSSMNNSELKEQVSEDTKSTSKADPVTQKESSLHQSWIESKNENLLDATREEKMRLLASNDYVKDNSLDLASENNQTSLTNGKSQYSLLQFALQNFVQAIDKYELIQETTVNSSPMNGPNGGQVKVVETLRAKKNKKKSGKNGDKDWTWKNLADLVKYSSAPLTQPLLKHSHAGLNKISLECFGSIMGYMGDLKLNADQTEVDAVYNILVNCHKHFEIRDEVYCQLMKQTTSNKSLKPDSCQKGWRLFSIVTAYFDCSDNLRPYLFKYLETTAYDKRRAYHATALVCLQNFRKTLRFGGRKNVPSVEEILAISAGRNSKRQMYRLPGGSERVVNTKSSTVVNDVIEEICLQLDATSSIEQQEFSLYCIVEGDFYTMPINRDEYILDITTELIKNGQIFYLIFCRSVWYHPLRLDCKLYIEVIFNQVVPDYLEGLLLVLSSNKVKPNADSPDEEGSNGKLALDPNVNIFADFMLGDQMVNDICRIAALLHRAADMEYQPTKEEVKYLLPKPILPMKFMKPNRWVELVQENWADMSAISTMEAKAQCLDCLSKWPLFGSCFFAVKHCVEYNATDFPEYILALNRNGAYFLDIITHETIFMFAYIDIISTRKVRAEDGTLFLDMKCGNLLRQSVTRIQTDQAHEISRLIRQYIEIQNHDKKVDPSTKSSGPPAAYIQDV